MKRVWPSEYSIWCGMLARCHNEKSKDYSRYGGRGITVCRRWRASFAAFFKDMGARPPGMAIDRINNDGNYTLKNCRWATPKENARNRRTTRFIKCFGEKLPLVAWAERTGISRVLIAHRIRAGWPVEKALTTTPDRSANSRHYQGANL